jgi:hypothetical protein
VIRRARAFVPGAVVVASIVVAAGCGGGGTTTTTVGQTGFVKAGVGPPAKISQFGYIKSLEPKGAGYVMRFDPAWMLSGTTANTAAVMTGAVAPGEPVPNDHYIVDEGHRLLTYKVPAGAHVTVLSNGVHGSGITVRQLSQLVQGKNPLGKPLFEPLTTGFWIVVGQDTVRSLDQQYKP